MRPTHLELELQLVGLLHRELLVHLVHLLHTRHGAQLLEGVLHLLQLLVALVRGTEWKIN